jgi:hypothetical protein
MTALSRFAAVPGRKFQAQDLNGSFNRKRTTANNRSMTELRTEQTFAGIAPNAASGPKPTFVDLAANGNLEPKVESPVSRHEALNLQFRAF